MPVPRGRRAPSRCTRHRSPTGDPATAVAGTEQHRGTQRGTATESRSIAAESYWKLSCTWFAVGSRGGNCRRSFRRSGRRTRSSCVGSVKGSGIASSAVGVGFWNCSRNLAADSTCSRSVTVSPPWPPPIMFSEHSTFPRHRDPTQVGCDIDDVSDRRRVHRMVVSENTASI